MAPLNPNWTKVVFLGTSGLGCWWQLSILDLKGSYKNTARYVFLWAHKQRKSCWHIEIDIEIYIVFIQEPEGILYYNIEQLFLKNNLKTHWVFPAGWASYVSGDEHRLDAQDFMTWRCHRWWSYGILPILTFRHPFGCLWKSEAIWERQWMKWPFKVSWNGLKMVEITGINIKNMSKEVPFIP